jgi:membrane protease YdiL (CAAX protease family)
MTAHPETRDPPLEPIGLLGSLLWFGVPAAVFAWFILWLLPVLMRAGQPRFLIFFATFAAPLALMLAAVFVVHRIEGRAWNRGALRSRLRLGRMTRTDWLWTIGLVAGTYALQWAIQPVAGLFEGVTFYRWPAEFAEFMSGMRQADFGFDLAGRWDVWLVMLTGSFVFNILGEELWWRGIILPRQEVALGKWAWLVNGLLWNLFHFFYHTSLASVIAYLPLTVPLAWVAQRTRSTWPGIVAHFIGNIALPIGILFKVLGLGLPGG